MRKLLIIFCVFIFSISLIAIEVSGNQSGIWSPDNNPYNMVGEITVPVGETLEIQAGVELIAMGNYGSQLWEIFCLLVHKMIRSVFMETVDCIGVGFDWKMKLTKAISIIAAFPTPMIPTITAFIL